jgi:hypothetical protein
VGELIAELNIPVTTARQHNPCRSMTPNHAALRPHEQALLASSPDQGASLVLLRYALEQVALKKFLRSSSFTVFFLFLFFFFSAPDVDSAGPVGSGT